MSCRLCVDICTIVVGGDIRYAPLPYPCHTSAAQPEQDYDNSVMRRN